MTVEDHKGMKKIQAWIPQETWDTLESRGYTSPTTAVTQAFKKLLEESPENPDKSLISLNSGHSSKAFARP